MPCDCQQQPCPKRCLLMTLAKPVLPLELELTAPPRLQREAWQAHWYAVYAPWVCTLVLYIILVLRVNILIRICRCTGGNAVY